MRNPKLLKVRPISGSSLKDFSSYTVVKSKFVLSSIIASNSIQQRKARWTLLIAFRKYSYTFTDSTFISTERLFQISYAAILPYYNFSGNFLLVYFKSIWRFLWTIFRQINCVHLTIIRIYNCFYGWRNWYK